jgi:hypothetical protein
VEEAEAGGAPREELAGDDFVDANIEAGDVVEHSVQRQDDFAEEEEGRRQVNAGERDAVEQAHGVEHSR